MLDVVHYLWYPSAFPGGKSVSVLNQGSKTPSDSLTNAKISEIKSYIMYVVELNVWQNIARRRRWSIK